MFLLSSRIKYRKDGLEWKRREDGSRLENHETLKLQRKPVIRCTYMFLMVDSNFQRRCYTLVNDTEGRDQVLVHYRLVSPQEKGRQRSSPAQKAHSSPRAVAAAGVAPAGVSPAGVSPAGGLPRASAAVAFEAPELCMEEAFAPGTSGLSHGVAASPLLAMNASGLAFSCPAADSMDTSELGSFLFESIPAREMESSLAHASGPLEPKEGLAEAMEVEELQGGSVQATRHRQSSGLSQSQVAVPITDYSPIWDWESGGAKVILVVAVELPPMDAAYSVQFDGSCVVAEQISASVLRCYAPQHSPGVYDLSICSGALAISNSVQFEYRPRSSPGYFPASFNALAFDMQLKEHLCKIEEFVRSKCAAPAGQADDSVARLLSSVVSAVDSNGMTLLQYAVVFGASSSVRLLVETFGADPFFRDANGCTALHLAGVIGMERFTELVKVRAGWKFQSKNAIELAAGVESLQSVLDYMVGFCTGPNAALAGRQMDISLSPDVLESNLRRLVLRDESPLVMAAGSGERERKSLDLFQERSQALSESQQTQGHLEAIKSSVRLIQAAYRSHRARMNLDKRKKAAIVIQQTFRKYHIEKKKSSARKEDAAKRILSAYRYYRFKKLHQIFFELEPPSMAELAEQSHLEVLEPSSAASFDINSLLAFP